MCSYYCFQISVHIVEMNIHLCIEFILVFVFTLINCLLYLRHSTMYGAYSHEVGGYIFFINKCYVDNTPCQVNKNFCHYKEHILFGSIWELLPLDWMPLATMVFLPKLAAICSMPASIISPWNYYDSSLMDLSLSVFPWPWSASLLFLMLSFQKIISLVKSNNITWI